MYDNQYDAQCAQRTVLQSVHRRYTCSLAMVPCGVIGDDSLVWNAHTCQSCNRVACVSVPCTRLPRRSAHRDRSPRGPRLRTRGPCSPSSSVPLCPLPSIRRRSVPSRDVRTRHGSSVADVRQRCRQCNVVCHLWSPRSHHLHRHRVAATRLDEHFRTARFCTRQPSAPSSARRLDQCVLPLHTHVLATSRVCRLYSSVSVDLQRDRVFSTGTRQGTAKIPKKIRHSNEQCE